MGAGSGGGRSSKNPMPAIVVPREGGTRWGSVPIRGGLRPTQCRSARAGVVLLVQGRADGEGDDDADRARGQEGDDDAAAQQQEEDQGPGEDGVLPGVAERAGERDGGTVDGADGGGPGAVEKGPGTLVATDLVEPVGAEQNEREGGAEGDHRGQDPADQA